jgi:dihydrofolate synthase/folylpolyglutamate synthase
MSEQTRATRDSEEGLRFLSSLGASGIRMGLDRIERALLALGNPERDYRILHVAGTNGKGSTCAFAATSMTAQGHRVGLYTSPHLVRVNERIQINGEEISDERLGERVLQVLRRYPDARAVPPPLTFFEFTTLVALWHFSRERVDIAVLETGLGGRLDATTAAPPTVTAITPIAFDHMDYLGDNLPAIAREKAGILRPGIPSAVSRQRSDALATLQEVAAQLGAPLYLEGRDFELTSSAGGALLYRGLRSTLDGVRLSLRGPHQVQNAGVALASLELLAESLAVSQAAMLEGMANTRWPGRLEEVESRPSLLLDGAHNPLGVESLVTAMRELYSGRRIHLVFGVLADKDYLKMIKVLFPLCSSVSLAPVDSPRALTPEKYLSAARSFCPSTTAHATVAEALKAARAKALPSDVVLCTGSLFLVGAVRELVLPSDAPRQNSEQALGRTP